MLSPVVEVSVVLPSFRAAPLALRSAIELVAFLPTIAASWEVVLVDDGGGDFAGHRERLSDSRLRLLELPANLGKGAAVRAGMLAATGTVRLFTDCDLPYGVEAIADLVRILSRREADVVAGDRRLPGSSGAAKPPALRRLASAAFAGLVRALVAADLGDTQCGVKGFRGEIADLLFAEQRIDRFAFDVELLALAQAHRLRVVRIPVHLRGVEPSSIRLGSDSLIMLFDLLRLGRRLRRIR